MSQVNGLLTPYSSIYEVEQYYFAPLSATSIVTVQNALYAFVGKVDSWPDEESPPSPQQNQAYIKQTFKNMFGAKIVTSKNISPVIPRIDWTTDTVYDVYRDDVDMFTYDTAGIIQKRFYVRNSLDQIFKCLWNKNGAVSTVEPILSPGTTNAAVPLTLSDGYKWIYITTIEKGLKENFFDDNWMPIPVGGVTPNVLFDANYGSIDAINVIDGGSGFSDGTATTIVNISGDGDGNAAGYAVVTGNTVQDVVITDTGAGYTYATVSVQPQVGYSGNNVNAYAVISPIGGNSIDPLSELGCNHVIVTFELNDGENGAIPTDVQFRQVGLLVAPTLRDGTNPTAAAYNTAYQGYTSFGLGNFQSGEIVYQGLSLASATYTGIVSTFDEKNNIVSIINTVGTPSLGAPILGNTSGTSRVLLQYIKPDFVPGSGYMVYVENRTPIQRSANGNEQFRLVLRF
jgi:hypothetical protein